MHCQGVIGKGSRSILARGGYGRIPVEKHDAVREKPPAKKGGTGLLRHPLAGTDVEEQRNEGVKAFDNAGRQTI